LGVLWYPEVAAQRRDPDQGQSPVRTTLRPGGVTVTVVVHGRVPPSVGLMIRTIAG
jgi:hypothetical protein